MASVLGSPAARVGPEGDLLAGPVGPISENAAPGTHAALAEMVLARPDCRRLMDVPCGAGAFTQRMLAAGREVISVDCVDEMLADRRGFRLGDMNARLPAADGELDAVVSIDGIEHLERPYDFVSECRRMIRPGGRLFLSTPNVSSLRSRWRWLWTGFHDKCKVPLDDAHPSPLHHVSMIELPKLLYMLRTRNFRIERITANRVKAASWLYLPLVPLAYLMTRWVWQREIEDPGHRARSLQVRRALFTMPVLLGEIVIVEAVREDDGRRPD